MPALQVAQGRLLLALDLCDPLTGCALLLLDRIVDLFPV
jgi:hypothetical protein